MCMIFRRNGTNKTAPFEAYKVYQIDGGDLVSPWKNQLRAGRIVADGSQEADIRPMVFILGLSASPTPLADSWIGCQVDVSGFHCIETYDGAKDYKDFLDSIHDGVRVIVKVTIHPDDVVMSGETPIRHPVYRNIPTVVARKMTISKEDFDQATGRTRPCA